MSDGTNRPFDWTNPADLGRFRMDAAGIVRDLLAAVIQINPDLITEEDRRQWWDNGKRPSNKQPDRILVNAATNLKKFEDSFGGYGASMPYFEAGKTQSPEEKMDELRGLILNFANVDTLRQAAKSIRNKDTVDWANLGTWSDLPKIRELLDELPDAAAGQKSRAVDYGRLLVTEHPNTIRFGEKPIVGATAGIWMFLDFLLRQPNQTANFDDLFGPNAVWDVLDDTEDNDGWTSVNSRIRHTNKMFRENMVPRKVSSNTTNRIVFLRSLESLSGNKTTPAERQDETPSKRTGAQSKPSAKKLALKNQPVRKQKR